MQIIDGGAVPQWSNLVPLSDQVQPDSQHHLVRQDVVDAGFRWYEHGGLRGGVAVVLASRSMLMQSHTCHDTGICGTWAESLMCAVNNRSYGDHTHTEMCGVAQTNGCMISGTSRLNCSQNPPAVTASAARPTCSKITVGTTTHRKWTSSPSNFAHECGWTGEPVVTKRRAFASDTWTCLLYTSPSPRDRTRSRMPSSA